MIFFYLDKINILGVYKVCIKNKEQIVLVKIG